MGYYYATTTGICRICGKEIKVNDRIYFEENDKMVHGLCLEEEADKERESV